MTDIKAHNSHTPAPAPASDEVEASGTDHHEPAEVRRPTRRWWWLGAVAALAAAVAAVVALTGGEDVVADAAPATRNTAEVVVADLVELTTYDGTLGRVDGDPIGTARAGTLTAVPETGEVIGQGDALYAVDDIPVMLLHGDVAMYRDLGLDDEYSIGTDLTGELTDVAAVGTRVEAGETLFSVDGEPVTLLVGDLPAYRDIGLAQVETTVQAEAGGVVTALPDDGATLEQGDVLFQIDDAPVVLLYGDAPVAGDLSEGDVGADVAQLQAALVDLGYLDEDDAPGGEDNPDDAEFDAATTDAVVAWQTDVGAEIDGVVNRGDVAFLAGPVEVTSVEADIDEGVLSGDDIVVLDVATPIQGEDVRQIEAALLDLGYADEDEFTPDDIFDLDTAEIVEEWQADIGATVDGVVHLGEVVFADGPVEVAAVLVREGEAVGDGPVLSVVAEQGLHGDDVAALESALVALGYDAGGTLEADGIMTEATVDALVAWQAATGQTVDGVANVGDVVFAAADVRVADVAASLGASLTPGAPVLQVTGNDVSVLVDLPAEDQGILAVDDAVTIELPDGTRTAGTVSRVATVATTTPDGTSVFEVEIALDDPAAAGLLDEAPVEVDVVSDSVEDAVTVPVTALLALQEGGYAVEVDRGDGTTELVAVDPGFFADGLVELVDSQVRPGTMVVVP